MSDVSSEIPLSGGFDPARPVVRVGDTVRRPIKASSPAVQTLLQALQEQDFDGVPRYLGKDDRGREILSFVDGQVPLPTYPAWSMTHAALASVGHLLLRFHQATARIEASGVRWALDRADPQGGPVICHNDLFPENVVFRDGQAVALIDFEMAAPGRALWDVAIAVQEWAPLHAPQVRWEYPDNLNAIARAATLAHAYGVKPHQAHELVRIVFEVRENTLTNIHSEIDKGNDFWRNFWLTRGHEQATADEAWLMSAESELIDAIAAPLSENC